MDIISVSHVSKSFGTQKVINDLSFTVPEHKIYGFIGKNGAGKTTTMKMILGLYTMDSGEILVNGEPVVYGQNRTNRYIGYLPDVPEFYNYMTPKEYLQLCAEITGMDRNTSKKRIPEVLELVGLEKTKKRIHGFSRGMKQRLGIAQALLNQPKLLICDEPTSALDPVGRKEILEILLAIREHTTIIFSTHILSDVERVCDEIGILNQGTIACKGTLEELRNKGHKQGYEIEFLNSSDREHFEKNWAGSKRLGSMQLYYEGKGEQDMMAAMYALVQQKLHIKRIEMCEPSLETLFMEVIDQ
jgi:ABC-2 type transport system ATP-binding protein